MSTLRPPLWPFAPEIQRSSGCYFALVQISKSTIIVGISHSIYQSRRGTLPWLSSLSATKMSTPIGEGGIGMDILLSIKRRTTEGLPIVNILLAQQDIDIVGGCGGGFIPWPLALAICRTQLSLSLYTYLITLNHYIPTNLEPRQGLWRPMCLVFCSAALVAQGFETSEMPLQSPVLHPRCYCPAWRLSTYLPYLAVLLPAYLQCY